MPSKGWSLERKIALGFGVSMVLLTLAGAASYHSLRLYMGILDEQIKTDGVIKALENTVGGMSEAEAEAGEKGFLLSGRPEKLKSFQLAERSLGKSLQELRKAATQAPEQRGRIKRLEALILSRVSFLRKSAELRLSKGLSAVQGQPRGKEDDRRLKEMRALSSKIEADQRWALRGHFQRASSAGAKAILAVLLGNGLAALFLVGAAFLIRRDMGERERARRQLEESEERLRDFLDGANDLIQSVGPDMRFLFTNRAWRLALGYSQEELEKMTLLDVVAPDQHEHCRGLFERVLTGEQLSHVETVFLAKDGRRVLLSGSVNCRLDEGRPIATRAIFRDVTGRRMAEEALADMDARLKAVMDAAIQTQRAATAIGKAAAIWGRMEASCQKPR